MHPSQSGWDDDEFPRIISGLFAAACGEEAWETATAPIHRRFESNFGMLVIDDYIGYKPEILTLPEWSVYAISMYAGYYASIDPHASYMRRQQPMSCILGQEMVDPAVWLRSEMWNDFNLQHLPFLNFACLFAPLEDGRNMRLTLSREIGTQAFSEAERSTLSLLLPYLQRAVQLRDRLTMSGGFPETRAFFTLMLPLLVVGPDGKVLACNAAAETICCKEPLLIDRHGLHATNAADTQRLKRLLQATGAGGSGGGLLLRERTGESVLAVLVSPLPTESRLYDPFPSHRGNASLVTIKVLAPAISPDPEWLQQLFGLSLAEAEVARALAAGTSIVAIAQQQGKSPLTVRAQIRAILAKTGSDTLRDLVRKLSMIGGNVAPCSGDIRGHEANQ